MSRIVKFSEVADKNLQNLLEYLIENWSLKVKSDFIKKLDKNIELLKSNPESFPKSNKQPKLYKCVLTKHTTLYYTFNNKEIFIITLFDTRQDPKKIKKDLT